MLRRLTLLLSKYRSVFVGAVLVAALFVVSGCAGHVQLEYCFERPINDACFEGDSDG